MSMKRMSVKLQNGGVPGWGLERKLTLILLAFAVVMSAAIWGIGYEAYRNSTFSRYRSAAVSVLNLAQSLVDADDMRRCLETGVKSAAYDRTQAFLDKIKENMNVAYLYLFDVTQDGRILYFLTAVTESERESSSGTEISSLGDEDRFPDDVTRQLLQTVRLTPPFDEIVNRTQYGYMFSVYSPVKDSKGEIIGLIGVDFDMSEIDSELTSYGVTMAAGSVTIALAFAALLIFFVRRNVTAPIKVVAEKAGEFAAANLNENGLSAIKLGIRKKDEIGVLASVFEKMTEDLVRYVTKFAAAVAAKERIESELNVARDIQTGMLPSLFPAFPDAENFDLYASMTPAREVGGDFYDFFMTDDSHLAVVIADVSGKGAPAALFMMAARTLIKREARLDNEPSGVLKRVNGILCANNNSCMFMTAFIGVYDVRTGLLKYASAGHNAPLVIKKGGKGRFLESHPSLVLAVNETARYESRETTLEGGEGLLLYTDGVTEAFNAKGEIFSEARLAGVAGLPMPFGAHDLVENVLDELTKFVDGAEQSDDITLLALVRKETEVRREREKTFPADVSGLHDVQNFV